MNMGKDNEKLESRLSYEVVKEIAPDEIKLFNDIEKQFLNKPGAILEKDRKKREKMLGFALPPGTEQLITIFVLPVVYKIIEKYFSKKDTGIKLDANTIKKLREDAFNTAISAGMKQEKAELLADCLVGKITLMGS